MILLLQTSVLAPVHEQSVPTTYLVSTTLPSIFSSSHKKECANIAQLLLQWEQCHFEIKSKSKPA